VSNFLLNIENWIINYSKTTDLVIFLIYNKILSW
jgi:hypothetical protein